MTLSVLPYLQFYEVSIQGTEKSDIHAAIFSFLFTLVSCVKTCSMYLICRILTQEIT